MTRSTRPGRLDYDLLTLGGRRYAVVPESLFLELARRLELAPSLAAGPQSVRAADDAPLDARRLAARLIERRKQAGLTQAQLARRARVRVETLNRIERGHTTPDFATIRKLLQAMEKVEQREMAASLGPAPVTATGEKNA